jgi:hypothetical protein
MVARLCAIHHGRISYPSTVRVTADESGSEPAGVKARGA